MRLHASSCASCRKDEAALGILCRELNVLPSVDPPLFFADNVRSAIERQRKSQAATAPWWRTFFLGDTSGLRPSLYGQVGRVAVGTLLTGGAVAAIGWTLLLAGALPHAQTQANLVHLSGDAVPGMNGATEATPGADPVLRIAQVTTMAPGTGPAYDLSFWVNNADRGVARWKFVGDPREYSFLLRNDAPQIVRIPYSVAQGNNAIALSVRWTAAGTSHTRYLLLPGAAGANGAATQAGRGEAPADRQSFGLAEESVVDAAREISARYGVSIAIDDVPESARVRVTAQDETAVDALRRNLKVAGLTVKSDTDGIHITAQADSTAPQDGDVDTSPKSSAE